MKQLVTIRDAEGVIWDCRCEVNEITVRRGNYSPIASDPEEYFGVHRYELEEILWMETEDTPDGEYICFDSSEVPEWAFELVEEELREWD